MTAKQTAYTPFPSCNPLSQTPIFQAKSLPPLVTSLICRPSSFTWTNVSGPIPPFLAQLKNLENLHLSFNNLFGPIPSSLSQLPNLTSLHLDRNKLTGQIPDSFGSFKMGPDLLLSHNQLSGPIPASLAHLNLERIFDQKKKKKTWRG